VSPCAAAAVRAGAVHALAIVLPAIETFPASDANVFPEFVWPSLAAGAYTLSLSGST